MKSPRLDVDEPQRPELLCGNIMRSVLANDRVQCNAARRVVVGLETPKRDGTMCIVMSLLEFMQRLAALVPRPRLQRRTAASRR